MARLARLPADEHKRRVDAVFDRSAAIYERGREAEEGFRRLSAWLLLRLGDGAGRRLLEVGCGAGSLLVPLHRAGFRHLAVDRSEEMALRCAARARAAAPRGAVVRADGEALPFPDASFDVVLAVGLLEYLPSDGRFLREAARVLVPGGRLLLTVPSATAPRSVAVGVFNRLPKALRARLLGRAPGERLHPIQARPARLGRLRRELACAGFAPRRWRFGEFVFFPLDRLAPGLTSWVARTLEPLGDLPLLSRLGSQLLIEAARGPLPESAASTGSREAWSRRRA